MGPELNANIVSGSISLLIFEYFAVLVEKYGVVRRNNLNFGLQNPLHKLLLKTTTKENIAQKDVLIVPKRI